MALIRRRSSWVKYLVAPAVNAASNALGIQNPVNQIVQPASQVIGIAGSAAGVSRSVAGVTGPTNKGIYLIAIPLIYLDEHEDYLKPRRF